MRNATMNRRVVTTIGRFPIRLVTAVVLVGLVSSMTIVSGQISQLALLDDYSTAGPPISARGHAVTDIGDLDGDGHADFVSGDPLAAGSRGRVKCFSGRTGTTIWARDGLVVGDAYGFALDSTADVDGDGHGEVVIGVPGSDASVPNGGRVEVVSGIDGSLVSSMSGFYAGGRLGYSVAGLAGVMDSESNLIVGGAPFADGAAGINCGAIVLFTPSGGPMLSITIEGQNAGAEFGFAMDGLGDFDGGVGLELAVGAPGDVHVGNAVGGVTVYRFGPTDVSAQLWGSQIGSRFGEVVCGVGDVNGDGLGDVGIGAPSTDFGSVDLGWARVYTGPAATSVHSHVGFDQNERVGQSFTAVGDIDGDGHADYALGRSDPIGAFNAHVQVISGRTGGTIARLYDVAPTFASTLRGLGDVDGDSIPDIAVGDAANGNLAVYGLDWRNPGSREDLVLRTGLNAEPPLWWRTLRQPNPGDLVTIHMESPNGHYVGTPPVVLAQPYSTFSSLSSPPGYPEVQVEPESAVFLVGGIMPMTIGPPVLPMGGIAYGFVAPPALGGQSLMIQGACLAPSAKQGNMFFTTTDAHEIRF